VRRLNVLITSSYYWPEEAGSAPYITGLAEHLSSRGDRVVVATGYPHYPSWRLPPGSRLFASEYRAGVEIRRRWHYVPGAQSAMHRALYEASLFGLGLTALRMPPRPDVVVGTCPSLAGGALAATAAAFHGAPYGLVFQDLMGQAAEQSGVAGGEKVASTVRKAELMLARRAAAVAIIAEGFRGYLEEGGVEPAKIHRLRNWTRRVEPTETAEEIRGRLGWRADEFVCLHGGNMGQKQGLDNLLDAAALLRGRNAKLVLAGDGNDRARLEQRAAEQGLDNVAFIELQPPGRWEALMQASDVLLVNQRSSVTDMSLPSKLTSYFAAGRPVVAAASAGSETAREIEEAHAGIIVPPAEPEALADAILVLAAGAEAARLGANAMRYAREVLSADKILAEYERFVELVAQARPPRRRARSPAALARTR
jgi:colanic acid biosynthesis glycosyl transferase WcaI